MGTDSLLIPYVYARSEYGRDEPGPGTVSVFSVVGNGVLTQIAGSPFATGGFSLGAGLHLKPHYRKYNKAAIMSAASPSTLLLETSTPTISVKTQMRRMQILTAI
ncbi:MAG TPA: hypothetical protein VI935_10040 [Thermodesulfobacteriota bacterium]|nr:hypothetical protein [Thermodesulfobacteriota bacterium]